jgi:hypothetical protein
VLSCLSSRAPYASTSHHDGHQSLSRSLVSALGSSQTPRVVTHHSALVPLRSAGASTSHGHHSVSARVQGASSQSLLEQSQSLLESKARHPSPSLSSLSLCSSRSGAFKCEINPKQSADGPGGSGGASGPSIGSPPRATNSAAICYAAPESTLRTFGRQSADGDRNAEPSSAK